ncbi:hypothetical protein [Streptomyces phytophilus]|uniref:hypothetical protein n=1 Tax=Streptomyces phytophilus TaxID=722715 RepID=UPI0015F12097|nr:hypothetical protein [Streptomyces phytophilus]
MEAIPALRKALAAHVKTGSGHSSDLTSLALVISTPAGEQDTEPQLVSLQDIRSAWADTG